MRFEEEGDPRPPRVPALGELWDRFPGPVAMPLEPISRSSRHVGYSTIDDQPWSIHIEYMSPVRHLLTVRTVRSRADLNPYGLPVEDLPGAIVAAANADLGTTPGAGPDPQDSEAWVQQHIAASRVTRAEVARTPTVPTSMSIDGIQIEGTRVDVAGRAAVHLTWGEQSVFCAGRPEIIDGLALRSATRDEFVAE